MNLKLSPFSTTAYTDKGNKYQHSYFGRTVALTTLGVCAVADGVGFTSQAVKNVNLSSLKPANVLANTKTTLAKFFGALETLASKAQDKLLKPAQVTEAVEQATEAAAGAVKSSIFKRALDGLKNFGDKVVETVKNPKMPEFLKKPQVVKGATTLGVGAAILAAGITLDYLLNKVRAKNADKEVLLK